MPPEAQSTTLDPHFGNSLLVLVSVSRKNTASMYRPKVDPNSLPLRLPPLESLPASKDITEMLHQAQKTPGRFIELSWLRPGTDVNLALSCHLNAQGTGEPIWQLTEGLNRALREIWTYPSGDLALILNLVTAECTGDTLTLGDSAMLAGTGQSRLNTNTSSSYSTSFLGLQATTGQRMPVINASRYTKIATMEGELTDLAVPNLLQSINMGKMTGCLFVDNGQSAAELFFEDGSLNHATAMDLQGEQAIMELVTWEKGKFYFYRDEKNPLKTIVKRIDVLMMEGVTLVDQSKSLMAAGLKMESYIDKKVPLLSEQDFEKRVSKGAPVDMPQQKAFYLQLDGGETLFDLLRKRPMVKKEWVPILFNLLNCDLIVIAKKSAKNDKTAGLESTAIDVTAIERVNKMLARPDTGIISYPSFHYFLEQEFQRYKLYQTPYSVIIFEMWNWHNNQLQPLTPASLQEACNRIKTATRSLDLFAHFEALSYVILLPNTETPAAAMLAHRILEMLRMRQLGPESNADNLALAFGVAGMPEDCKDTGLLLSAAKASKLVAQRNNYPIVMFKDMQSPTLT